ncbi:hypothetical protein DOTSEDRAFT_150350 [Dothistroma septosporum NZE10]|uniref:PUM-HD domain-containing protein n=1 Tax=Dothistroma septosporum (strain NZE10 / CBS 128990) TaxID=675120 RepID=N1PPP2_DOTSN|nr:hypothetical protein DOTSEDRAFT_150350 [Dothistroma septosporum NZE10]
MAPATRPGTINLEGLPQLNMGQTRSANGSGANSPIDAPAGSGSGSGAGSRFPFANGRAGSPSKAYGGGLEGSSGSRLFPKRAREIQQQEGLSPQPWGPPTTGSGHSTPLRETIPESPGSDSFPDFDVGNLPAGSPGALSASNSVRRSRAGTVPSRFPAMGSIGTTPTSAMPKPSRATPSVGPYQSGSPSLADSQAASGAPLAQAALLSRLRAGSMPQRALLNTTSPFGNSLFASNWMAGRERASTLQSIRSSNEPSSPNGPPAENDVRTLDYLGLVDTPQSGRERGLSRADMDILMNQQRANGTGGVTIADLAALNAFNKNTANRFRSYSVNAKEKYADGPEDELDEYEALQQQLYSGTFTPNSETTAAQAAAINEAVRQHNLEVQAFANFASANRPRARTAGVLDSPSQRVLRNYMPTPSRLADSSMTAADLQSNDGSDFSGLATAVHNMNLNKKASYEGGLDPNLEAPTRSLWLGNIPSSTTVSSLNVIFSQFGPIEFARVLTHKSCGFVNFENVQSAMAARAQYNGKEIFPGCGTIRIGYAKEQSASNTPGANGAYPSPSPDPFISKSRIDSTLTGNNNTANGNINAETAAAALATPNLLELRDEIYDIVQQFGASPDDQERIAKSLETAMSYDEYAPEISPIPEPSHSRVHDAPRLREIRKRIDNNSCGPMETEQIAVEMLPEIAELSSDYLGNTVVQKLFENCSEETKEAMLAEISPHLAEIGVHKNGTWAAQKVIDVARTANQMHMVIDALKPHAVNLFLDQYGNYVMQCCLRFQAPLNDFIFDSMLNRLWDVAQGRFGARAMRACLESHFATNDHKRLMAAAIALHSVQLATSSNGALLLTWFLDTCTFPQRRSVLAPRLIPHLVHLCTHKVAYLTVLKIINQRNEPEARDSILRALFFDEQTLTDIVSDHTCGATLIFKVLTTPFLDESIRPECLENVRNVLLNLKAQPSQGYKRLMDEVGLSTRHGGTPISHDGRSSSKSRPINGHLPHLDTNPNGYGRHPYTTHQHHPMDQGMTADLQRSISMDSNGFDPYVQQYTHSPAMSNAGISPIIPLQYQQAMLAQGQMARPPGFYGSPGGVTPSTGLPNGMGYGTGSPAPQMMDPYQQMNGSPMMAPGMGMQAGYQQQSYGNQMMGMNGDVNGYGQYQMPNQFYGQAQMQGQMASSNNRRGRVGPRY